jgi:hypothetical protein
MKLKRICRVLLTLGFAIVGMNLTAPASQADAPTPPMGFYVIGGTEGDDAQIFTTHFAENIVNFSLFEGGELRESSNFQTGDGPIALAFDFSSDLHTANIGDSTVTRVYYPEGSDQINSCTVATGPDDFTGVNPVAITLVPGGVVTGNIGDNTVSSLQFDNACQLLSRTVVPTPNGGNVTSNGRGPVAFYTSYSDAESIVLNSQAKTLQSFDGEQFLYDPYPVNFSDEFWNSSLEPEEDVYKEDFYPVGLTEAYGYIFILFDEYLHLTQTSNRQHLVRLSYYGDDLEYIAGFDSPGWTVPNSQRLVFTPNALCLITSSSVITCWRGNNPNLTIDTGHPGLAALTTDYFGNLYAANSIDKTVTRFNSDGSVNHVFQISLTQPSSNSNQGNSTSAPSSPTSIVAKTTGKRSATVSFAPPASNGGSAITSYTATSTPGGITKTLTQSSDGTFTFDNLQPGTSYTFAVTAANAIGTSVAAISNSIKTIPLEVASISSLSFVDDGTGTGGKIVWSGKSIDSVLYTGPVNSYPGPYNYGAFTSGWNGKIRNLTPGTSYTVSLYAISADGVGESKSLTFKTSATLPALAGAANITTPAQTDAAKLSQMITWVNENTSLPGEAANISNLLTKFMAIETSPHRSFVKVPTSRVSTVVATSLTPKSCSVVSTTAKVDAGMVKALTKDTCTISYTVTGGSKAPVTLVKDFVFKKVG